MTPLGLAVAFAHAVVWGATNVMLRHLAVRMDPFLLSGMRAVVGAVVIGGLFLAAGAPDAGQLTAPRLLLLAGSIVVGGVFGGVANVTALRLVGVARTVPLANTFPMFTLLFSWLALGEPLRLPALGGALLVIVGASLLSIPDRPVTAIAQRSRLRRWRPARPAAKAAATVPVTPSASPTPATAMGPSASPPPTPARWRAPHVVGVLLATVAAAAWGLETVLVARGMEGMGSLAANIVRVPLLATITMTIGTLRAGAVTAARTALRERGTLAWLVATGLVSWVGANLLFTESLRLVGANLTAIIAATAPIYAAPLSAVLLHEPPSRLAVAGTVLAVAGVVVVLVV